MESAKYSIPMKALKSFEDELVTLKARYEMISTFWLNAEKDLMWSFTLCSSLLTTVFFRDKLDLTKYEVLILVLINLSLLLVIIFALAHFKNRKAIISNVLLISINDLQEGIKNIKICDLIGGAKGINVHHERLSYWQININQELSRLSGFSGFIEKTIYGKKEVNKWIDRLKEFKITIDNFTSKFESEFGKNEIYDISNTLSFGLYYQDNDPGFTWITVNLNITRLNGFVPRLRFCIYLLILVTIMSHLSITIY